MLELTMRVTIILGAAWLLAALLSRAAAATRHLVWHAAFIAIVTAPILAPITPQFTLPGIAPFERAIAHVQQVQGVQVVQGVQQVQRVQQLQQLPGVPGTPRAPAAATESTSRTLGTLGTVGTLGTLTVACWFLVGWVSAVRRVRRAAAAPVAWQLEMQSLCEKLRIARPVRLAIMPDSGSPLATGIWRASVLLPRCATEWSADRRRAVLLHELAHIRRGDCRAQLLTHVACALYWFNPLVWRAAFHLRAERERACDDEVLRSGARPSTYAAHLLSIARELRPVLRPSAALAMARTADLEGRLLAVLADRARTPSPASRWAIATTFVVMTMAALGATGKSRETSASPTADATSGNGFTLAQLVTSADASPAQSVGPLQQALEDEDQDVREKATLALAFMSGREVVPALLTALRDRDSQVREKAAIGLALRRDSRAIEPLLAALQDPDSQVREKVAIALGSSGDPRARSALHGALKDADAQVREEAASALILLGFTQ